MAKPDKHPHKRRITILPGERSSDTPGVLNVRMDAKTIGVVAAFLLVVAVLVIIFRRPEVPSSLPAGGAGGAVPSAVAVNSRSADMQPSQNRPPAVDAAAITTSDPDASTPLQVQYSAADPDGDAVTVEIRWYINNTLVQTGPSDVLQPGVYRKGSSVYAEVVPADQQSSGNAYTTAPIIIKNAPPRISPHILEPEEAFVGTVITATPAGTDPDGDPITYTYQWRVNENPVGAPSGENTFSTAGLRKRDIISAVVTYSDGTAEGRPVVSNSIRLQNGSPKIASTPPTDLSSGLYIYQVSAKDPDGDPLTYRLDRFPSGMTIDASSGLIRWELPKAHMFTGRNEVAVSITVDDKDGGTDSQQFTIVFTDLIVN